MNFLQGRNFFVRIILLLVVVTLVTIGITTIYALEHPPAQTVSAPDPHTHSWDLDTFNAWENWQKQFAFAILGLAAFIAVNYLNYRRLGPISYWIYALSLILLAIVLVGKYIHLPFVPRINGSYRWIKLPGLPQLQASEFARLSFILALAWYLRYRSNYRNFASLIGPFALTLAAMILILLEPDLGTVLLMMPVLFAMLFVAGAKPKHLLLIILMALTVSPILWTQIEPYQRKRIATVVLQNQWLREKAQHHPFLAKALVGKPTLGKIDRNEGFQLLRSKLAIASGSVTGTGFDRGTFIKYPKLLPENRTDFIFSIIAHQYGFIGSMLLLLLYIVLILCSIEIAIHNSDPFGRLIVIGIVAMFAAQVVVNVSMTVGLLPVTGLTLPLVSYGGSSLLVTLIAVGLLNNIGRCHPFTLKSFN